VLGIELMPSHMLDKCALTPHPSQSWWWFHRGLFSPLCWIFVLSRCYLYPRHWSYFLPRRGEGSYHSKCWGARLRELPEH
jgi:hypothetical protein